MIRLHLNEIQFDRVLGHLLIEGAETLSSIYEKWYSDIPENVFMEIVMADPTYKQEKSDKMGKYGKWLLGLYKRGALKLEDLYKATEYLSYFTKYINKIVQKDIMKYRDLPSLYDIVKPFIDAENNGNEISTSKADEIRKVKKDVKKVYEDGNWLILIPLTQEASIFYGKNTQWCTAAEHSSNMFNEYNNKGPLYINIDKRTNRKYQFHFQTNSFMDEHDKAIEDPIAETIGMDESIVNAAYPHAVDTLLVDSDIWALGDGLYYDESKSYVYRLYDAGMFQNQLGYERKKIAEHIDPDYCLKLSKNIWWFKRYRETHGYFYNITDDSVYENEEYKWLNIYKHPTTKRNIIFGYKTDRFKARNAFVGHMNGDEIVIDTLLGNSSFETLEEYTDNGYYFNNSSILKRYLITGNGCEDAETNEESFDLYDIVKMNYVARDVVTIRSEYDAQGNEYIVLRDSISYEDVYQRASEVAMENPDDYYDYNAEIIDEYYGDVLNDFLKYQARRYYISLKDGELYEDLPK